VFVKPDGPHLVQVQREMQEFARTARRWVNPNSHSHHFYKYINTCSRSIGYKYVFVEPDGPHLVQVQREQQKLARSARR